MATAREMREMLWNTAIMDWPAWGPDVPTACEEMAFAIAAGWPSKAEEGRQIERDVKSGALEPEEGFGFLQGLVPEQPEDAG